MSAFQVTRAHLKSACDAKNWDLLDRLLELDAARINDNSLYTDTWGIWWGLMMETARLGEAEGVKVLLKHGAKRDLACWGDGIEQTPLEMARDFPEVVALLTNPDPPVYIRKTDPQLPQGESSDDAAVNRQGEILDKTGIAFQIPNLKSEIGN